MQKKSFGWYPKYFKMYELYSFVYMERVYSRHWWWIGSGDIGTCCVYIYIQYTTTVFISSRDRVLKIKSPFYLVWFAIMVSGHTITAWGACLIYIHLYVMHHPSNELLVCIYLSTFQVKGFKNLDVYIVQYHSKIGILVPIPYYVDSNVRT